MEEMLIGFQDDHVNFIKPSFLSNDFVFEENPFVYVHDLKVSVRFEKWGIKNEFASSHVHEKTHHDPLTTLIIIRQKVAAG